MGNTNLYFRELCEHICEFRKPSYVILNGCTTENVHFWTTLYSHKVRRGRIKVDSG